jgi:crotonobetainyl-CoA:carnitine CoA-transferase CaiB-like acyl-CoA transferase
MWAALGGEPTISNVLSYSGEGSLPGVFAFTDLCAASLAVATLAVAELLQTLEGRERTVHVDRVLASGWALNLAQPVGPRPQFTSTPTINGEYPTADGRWLRLTAAYPHIQERMLAVLGTETDREAVAAEIARHRADEIEQALVDGGGAVAASRSLEEWADHPAGRAVAAEPLVDITSRPVPHCNWQPTPGRPLAGIRVLDCTRVIAGPMATRFLAGFGAEVLRIDPPGFEEEIEGESTVNLTLGKRCARLDLKSREGRERFLELLGDADIFVHGYRAGVFDALGIGAQVREQVNPALIEVLHNAYGWSGPWVERRGFDSTVTVSTGIWLESMAHAGVGQPSTEKDPTIRIVHPRVLDHCAGYLNAASAIRGLTRRLTVGEGSVSRLSLARMLALLVSGGRPPQQPEITIPLDGPFDDLVHTTFEGPVRRLRAPISLDGNPFFWERPGDRCGTATPVWT